jgi:hypothetical protein
LFNAIKIHKQHESAIQDKIHAMPETDAHVDRSIKEEVLRATIRCKVLTGSYMPQGYVNECVQDIKKVANNQENDRDLIKGAISLLREHKAQDKNAPCPLTPQKAIEHHRQSQQRLTLALHEAHHNTLAVEQAKQDKSLEIKGLER